MESESMAEKVICPYCRVNLQDESGVDDEIARCGLCGEITCGLCINQHFNLKHPGMIQYGIWRDKFIYKDFTRCED